MILTSAPDFKDEESEPAPPVPTAVDKSAPRHTLLYVEDNPANLKLVEQLIARRPDMRLLTAVNGRLGLELAHEHHPDLILLDLHLPDLGGQEVLAHLRADLATHDIPVVILSADATRRHLDEVMELGAHGYLTMPIDVRQGVSRGRSSR